MSAPAQLACGQCGAALAFVGVRTATCPYCGSSSFLPRTPVDGGPTAGSGAAGHRGVIDSRPEPRFAVAFASDATAARQEVMRWLGGWRLFTDRALRTARVEDMRGVYVPAYLYSAVARTTYTAQIGERYSETVDVPVGSRPGEEPPDVMPLPWPGKRLRKPKAKPVTEQRVVTRTEYRALQGRHFTYVTDVLVSASGGLARHELARLQPYDYRQLRRFSPALVAGFVQEDYALAASAVEQASRAAAAEQVASKLRSFLPGDSYSDLEVRTQTQWESLDPLLVPVWILGVRFRADRPPLRVLVNGQTNVVVGRPPLVWWKVLIALGLVAALALLAWRFLS